MVLDKWTTGDLIDADSANKRGVRRGTTSDRDGLAASAITPGDHFFNETLDYGQVLLQGSPNIWGNYAIHLLGSDSTEATVTGSTPTQVKDIDLVKDPDAFVGFVVLVIAEIKTDNIGTTASLRVRENGGVTDSLILTTINTAYEIKKGTIDVTGWSAGRNTLEVFLDDGVGDTVSNRMIEFWGV